MDIDFGIDKKNFFKSVNEKTFFLKRAAVDVSKFDWSNVDQALYSWDIDINDVKIFKNGIVDSSEFLENFNDYGRTKIRIKKHAFYQHLMEGSSISFHKFHLKEIFSNKLAMEISRFTDANTCVNAYAAIGGQGTFDKHFDTHDVFAIQLIGKKRWKLYNPSFEKPLPIHKSKPLLSQSPQEPVLDIILNEGDMLYIPRGMWHEAIPIENQETLHLAIGTYPLKVSDFCEWVIKNKIHESIVGREYLIGDHDSHLMESLADCFKRLVTNKETINEFVELKRSEHRFRSEFNLKGLLSNDIFQNCEEKKFKFNSLSKINDEGKIVINGISFEFEEKAVELLKRNNYSVYRIKDEKDLEGDYIADLATKLNFLDIVS
ncbi:cupin-like domain-containing protein [Pseudoalteromonas tunicata]|uniref:JmjC domain-containing protein n=1 Tax=Pseudoalteromonas tunicata TaxID=314281 RepID=UPI00273F459D|nr:cupin domain-containing protein [Pseudoalteromonas tunicata]MDP5215257.1 cupin-like domain-containing protein [Pseudoalteromonas tunicata]